MEAKKVKGWLQGKQPTRSWEVDSNGCKFFDLVIVKGLRIDRIEPGRVLCSFQVPPRLTVSWLSSTPLHHRGTEEWRTRWSEQDDRNAMRHGAVVSLVDLVGSAVFYAAGAPSTGVSVEISVSAFRPAYVHSCLSTFGPNLNSRMEEVEIEATVLHLTKTVAVAAVEMRKRSTGTMIAWGRHTKYLAVSSKL
ncbi:hypothetical protein B296_00041263 [Ensete ventricosum]|uniref:Thioesterase domain-containing protein n=1 Tax=Ensete ventricosum TaxID=4639 RepID=A0A426ZMF6_ENSVE|nr:hypothetical protein B296_00041263 [Ensete ventricosum]